MLHGKFSFVNDYCTLCRQYNLLTYSIINEHFVCFRFRAVMNKPSMNSVFIFFVHIMFHFLFGYVWINCIYKLCFSSTVKYFSKGVIKICIFIFPPVSYPHPYMVFSVFFKIIHYVYEIMYHHSFQFVFV